MFGGLFAFRWLGGASPRRGSAFGSPASAQAAIGVPWKSRSRFSEASDPPVVRAPVPNAFLDLFTSQVLLESHFGESYYFVIPGKAQADQLTLVQAVDLHMPF